jgi:hypothetical protein
VPVFHGWIKDKALDELLIDVVDYGHVHHGPGVLLVGHASDYYIDLGEGRPGLLYSRKRDALDDPRERILDAFRRALVACAKLESEPSLKPPVRFLGNELLFRLNDRLSAPNTDATFQHVEPALREALDRLYAGAPYALKREGAERELFTVRVTSSAPTSVKELLQRLM